ncbi:MAG: hypothetical protein LBT27_05140 [Prevotellaceae bacterium]|jgi:hypothetical protein|nr:hypothetical protein [Prevotellaceae bacterium]
MKTYISLILATTLICFISCNKQKTKKNETDVPIQINVIDTTIAKNIDKTKNYEDTLELNKDNKKEPPIFLQCLEISDSTKILEWLEENEIDYSKFTIYYVPYASDQKIEIYPQNRGLSLNNIQWCGYFYIKQKMSIIQIDGELTKYEDSKTNSYVDPNMIGDSCLFCTDREKIEQVVKKFIKAVKSGDKATAEKYIHFPVVEKIGHYEENEPEKFWAEFDLRWKILINNKIDLNFIGFGQIMDFFNFSYYDRSGIRYCEPQYVGNDRYYYDDNVPNDYSCGYFSMQYEDETESCVYYMRIIKIDGELKICSFFLEN